MRDRALSLLLAVGAIGAIGLGRWLHAQPVPVVDATTARMNEILAEGETRPEPAWVRAVDWRDEAVQFADRRGEYFARLTLARLAQRAGRYDQAVVELGPAASLAEQLADPALKARTLDHLGVVYALAGLHNEALLAMREALPLWEAAGNWERASAVLSNIGSSLGEVGDLAASRQHYKRALQMKQAHGIDKGIDSIHNNLADVAMDEGDFVQAQHELAQSLALAEAAANRPLEALARINQADLSAQTGEFNAGLAQLDLADSLIQAGEQRLQAFSAATRGKLLLRMAERAEAVHQLGLLDAALAATQRALALAAAMDDPGRHARVARLASDVHAARGEWQQALSLRDEAETHRGEVEARLNRARHAVLSAQYANERQARELAELRQRDEAQRRLLLQQRGTLYGSALLGGLLLLVVLLFWRKGQQRQRQQRQLHAANLALSRSLDQAEVTRQRAESLAESHQRLLRLVGDELRQPLLRVRSLAERLLVQHAEQPALVQSIAAVSEVADQLLRSAEQMVELRSTQLPATPLPADMAALLRDEWTVLTGHAQAAATPPRGIDQPCLARVDGARLQLLLHEVLATAAAPSGVLPPMQLMIEGDWVVLRIDDPSGQLSARLRDPTRAEGETLGALWIEDTARRLGGELAFEGPPVLARARVSLRLPRALASTDRNSESQSQQQ